MPSGNRSKKPLNRYPRTTSTSVSFTRSQGKVNPVQWWVDHQQQFPRLAALALDILAIPGMAADCERSFSIAKLSVSSQRHPMKPETLEMLQLMKDWLRSGDICLGGLFFNSI
jgi:hypothetical protein